MALKSILMPLSMPPKASRKTRTLDRDGRAGTHSGPNAGSAIEDAASHRCIRNSDDVPKAEALGLKLQNVGANFECMRERNLRREAPATYLKRNYKAPGRAMDYVRVTRSFFAVSAANQGTVYYSRCNFSGRSGGTIHCVDIKYPVSEKQAWDDIVTRISRSLEPREGG